jgi:hypothetical protein
MNYPKPSGSAHGYTDSYIDYSEVSTTPGYCGSNDALVEWSGIGGWDTGNLGQAGTAPELNGQVNHLAWFAVFPDFQNSGAIYENWAARAGDDMQVEVAYSTSAQRWNFYIFDNTTKSYSSEVYYSATYGGSSSEFVVERPVVNNSTVPPAKFGTAVVNAGQSGVDGASRIGMQNYPLNTIAMVNGTDVLATPDSSPNGQAFKDYWQRCS